MEGLTPVVACRSRFVALPERAIAAFCTRWDVQELRLIGSALHGPFRDDSDLDFVFHAPPRSPIYAPNGQLQRDARRELEGVVRRKVDLVCPRATLASANPYAIHNLLLGQRFDRVVGLAWYLRGAAHLLARASVASPQAALAGTPGRHLLKVALVRLARTCDSDRRVDEWTRRGLEDVPRSAP